MYNYKVVEKLEGKELSAQKFRF